MGQQWKELLSLGKCGARVFQRQWQSLSGVKSGHIGKPKPSCLFQRKQQRFTGRGSIKRWCGNRGVLSGEGGGKECYLSSNYISYSLLHATMTSSTAVPRMPGCSGHLVTANEIGSLETGNWYRDEETGFLLPASQVRDSQYLQIMGRLLNNTQ